MSKYSPYNRYIMHTFIYIKGSALFLDYLDGINIDSSEADIVYTCS